MDWRAISLINKYRAASNEENCPVCFMNLDSKIIVDCLDNNTVTVESQIVDEMDDLISFINSFKSKNKCKFLKYTQLLHYDSTRDTNPFEDVIEWDTAQDVQPLEKSIEALKEGKERTMFCFTLVNQMYLDPTLSYGTIWEKIQEDEEDEFEEETDEIRIMYLLIQFMIRRPMHKIIAKTEAAHYILHKIPEIEKKIVFDIVDEAYNEVIASTFESEQVFKETYNDVDLSSDTIRMHDHYKHHKSPFLRINENVYKALKLSVKDSKYLDAFHFNPPQDVENFEKSFEIRIEFSKNVKLSCNHNIHYDCLENMLKQRENVLIEKTDDDTRPIFKDFKEKYFNTWLRSGEEADQYILYPNDKFLPHIIPMKCPTCVTDKYFSITPCQYTDQYKQHFKDVFISEIKFNPLFSRNDIKIDHITDQ